MKSTQLAIKKLSQYFAKRDNISLAFLFGSRATSRERGSSDWDIGIYFKPEKELELETANEYPEESVIRTDIENMLASEVDLIILNRARPSLVFSVLNTGIPLIIKDERLHLKLISQTHYEAVDFWNFTEDFWKIYKQAASLTPEARAIVIEHLTFLKNEFSDLPKFKGYTQAEYTENRDARRNIERWIENIVMSSLDIAKTFLASGKKDVPPTYRETLRAMALLYFDETFAEQLSEFANLRNIVAHEYLDLRWQRIQNFIRQAENIYPIFIRKVEELLA